MSQPIFRDLRKRRFWNRLVGQALACLGALAVLAGVVDIFVPQLLATNLWVVWPSVLMAIFHGTTRAWPRQVETSQQSPRTSISLVCGELFEESEAHLVIGAVDTFDTAAPHISPASVQGQFLQQLYGNNVVGLDHDIDESLATNAPEETIRSKKGKNKRYSLGTVLTLRSQARRFLMGAQSQMDVRRTASATTDALWDSLSKHWDAVRAESNGGRVRIPMIRGGQSTLSPFPPAQDPVRFMVLPFMLASRSAKGCDELVIVARPSEYEGLDHLKLKAFFDSLRIS